MSVDDGMDETALREYIPRTLLLRLHEGTDLRWLAEMRTITTVFVKVTLTSEDTSSVTSVAQALQQAFRAISPIVRRAAGTVAKILAFDKGYTFMIVFGLPGQKLEDGCRRAVVAAREIQHHVQAMLGAGRSVGIGVATGPVYCGVLGHPLRHEYTIIGDSVNVAARLMAAFPQAIVCDQRTHTGIDARTLAGHEAALHFARLVDVQLRGKSDDVVLFKLIPAPTSASQPCNTLSHCCV